MYVHWVIVYIGEDKEFFNPIYKLMYQNNGKKEGFSIDNCIIHFYNV